MEPSKLFKITFDKLSPTQKVIDVRSISKKPILNMK